MALIQCLATLQKQYLKSCHIFGRNKLKADTWLVQPDISQLHASIRWEDDRWIIIDHSRNGTYIDGVRLPEKKTIELLKDTTIRFGGPSDLYWKIIDLSPPAVVLISLDEEPQIIELGNNNLFFNIGEDDVSLYLSEDGKWIYEMNNRPGILKNGDIVTFNSTQWRFCNPHLSTSTSDTLNNITVRITKPGVMPEFTFHVSKNEEYISISIHDGNSNVFLKDAAHQYMLLILARKRLEDLQANVDELSQGWIEIQNLCDMLKIDKNHLNIQVKRAREQIIATMPDNPHLTSLIERKRGEIRFNNTNLQIFSGSN